MEITISLWVDSTVLRLLQALYVKIKDVNPTSFLALEQS